MRPSTLDRLLELERWLMAYGYALLAEYADTAIGQEAIATLTTRNALLVHIKKCLTS